MKENEEKGLEDCQDSGRRSDSPPTRTVPERPPYKGSLEGQCPVIGVGIVPEG